LRHGVWAHSYDRLNDLLWQESFKELDRFIEEEARKTGKTVGVHMVSLRRML
jgi:divalent metal cation (Fe/Co/Zn/Cd) transporter